MTADYISPSSIEAAGCAGSQSESPKASKSDVASQMREFNFHRTLTLKEVEAVGNMRNKLKDTPYSHIREDVGQLLRFLEARDYNVEVAFKMLVEALQWRETYKPHKITKEEVADQLATGKVFWLDPSMHDKAGRPILCIMSGLHKMEDDPTACIRMVLYLLEEGLRSMKPGSDQKYVIIYDRQGFDRKNFDRPLLRDFFNILSNYYPETLAAAYVMHPNWFFTVAYKIVKLFMDVKTQKKVHLMNCNYKQTFTEHFDSPRFWSHYGGHLHWQPEYPHYLKL